MGATTAVGWTLDQLLFIKRPQADALERTARAKGTLARLGEVFDFMVTPKFDLHL
jgi:hypothetical protein